VPLRALTLIASHSKAHLLVGLIRDILAHNKPWQTNCQTNEYL
jgi:hypothetical protein